MKPFENACFDAGESICGIKASSMSPQGEFLRVLIGEPARNVLQPFRTSSVRPKVGPNQGSMEIER